MAMASLLLCVQGAGSTQQQLGLPWASGSWEFSFPSLLSSSAASTNAKNAKSAAKRRVSRHHTIRIAFLVQQTYIYMLTYVSMSGFSSYFSLRVAHIQCDSKSSTRILPIAAFRPHFLLCLFPMLQIYVALF